MALTSQDKGLTMIDMSGVPERVERLLQLAEQHGRLVTRVDVRLHPYGWRIGFTASTSIYVKWSDGKQGGRMECTARSLTRSRRMSVAGTEAAIIAGTVKL